MHKVEQNLLDNEPMIGDGDASLCLPSWIQSFCEWFNTNESHEFSHDAISALTHTLIAAKVRAARLVNERDSLAKYIDRLETQIRYIRDQRGDNKCRIDWYPLYAMLPEGFTPPEKDETVELELCKQYIASCHDPNIKYVSPQIRIEELTLENKRLTEELFVASLPLAIEELRANIDECKVAAWDALKSNVDLATKILEVVWGPQFVDGEQLWYDDILVEQIGKALTYKEEQVLDLEG